MIITRNSQQEPEPPAEIVSRLQQIDRALGLRFTSRGGDAAPYWALIYNWSDSDPRRRRILAGEIDPKYAFDLVTMLPMDCNVHDAYGFAINAFRRSDNAVIRALIDQKDAYNAEITKAIWNGATDDANNIIEVMGGKLFANEGVSIPKVYGPGHKSGNGISPKTGIRGMPFPKRKS